MRYVDNDGTMKPFLCGVCHAELTFDDQRDHNGVGQILIQCPNCEKHLSWFYLDRGELDLGLVREQVGALTDDFRVFP